MKTPDNLPTDPADIEQDAAVVLDDIADLVNSILIVGQLDAVEVRDGKPRWSTEQQALIIKCADTIGDWEK